jgi:hypothetical protein
MAMIDPNVMRAVGEALEAHGAKPDPRERLSDTVSRVLGLSDDEAHRWLAALSEGCTVEEANRRAGILDHRGGEPLLVAVARAIGSALGKVAG